MTTPAVHKYSPSATPRKSEKDGCTVDGAVVPRLAPGAQAQVTQWGG